METIVVELVCLVLVLAMTTASLRRRSAFGLISAIVVGTLSTIFGGYIQFGGIGAAVGLIASLMVGLGIYEALSIVQTWARRDFIFTILEEGRAAAVMSGQGLWRMVMQYNGHEFRGSGRNDDRIEANDDPIEANDDPIEAWEVIPSEDLHPWRESWEWLQGLLGLSGIKLIGWPGWHSLFWYRFAWASMEQKKDGTLGNLKFRPAELMKHIYVKPDSYAIAVQGAEDIEGVALRGSATVVIQIVNPAKALFRVEKWLEMTQALLVPRLRQWIGSVKGGWRTLQQKKTHDLTLIIEHNADVTAETAPQDDDDDTVTIKDRLEGEFGVRIISIQLLNLDPDGEEVTTNAIRAAATAPYVADQNAQATVRTAEATRDKQRIEAEGAAAATRLSGGAERDRINAIADAAQRSDVGLEILRLDTHRAMAQGAGTTFVIPDEVTSVLGKLGGRRRNEDDAKRDRKTTNRQGTRRE